MGKIRINKGHTMPLILRVGTQVVLCFVFYFIAISLPEIIAIPILIIVSLLGPIAWFSLRVLTIDTDDKTVHEGIWIMNFKIGKDLTFESVESIYSEIVEDPGSYKPEPLYKAYLKLDDGSIYTLLSNKSKKEVNEGISKIKRKLEID